MDEETELDDTSQFFIDQMNIHDAQLHSEMAELEKQKFTWLFQVVTIASAILGGFMLTKADRNILENIALGVLFVLIFLALLFVYLYNKQVREDTGKKGLYKTLSLLSALLAHQISKKDKLTKKDEAKLKEFDEYQKKYDALMRKVFKEAGGEITNILNKKEKPMKEVNISIVLLIGIFLAILVLIFADYII